MGAGNKSDDFQSKKKTRKSTNSDQQDECIDRKSVVNALNSLWVCQNAMNPKHECTFCMCNKCYMLKSSKLKNGNRTTRGRRNTMKSIDDNKKQLDLTKPTKKCDSLAHHCHRLNPFVDSLYFSSGYKAKIISNNANELKQKKFVPFHCTVCKYELVGK